MVYDADVRHLLKRIEPGLPSISPRGKLKPPNAGTQPAYYLDFRLRT